MSDVLTVNKNIITNSELSRLLQMSGEGCKKMAKRLNVALQYITGKGRGGKLLAYDLNAFPEDLQKKVLKRQYDSGYKKAYSEYPKWKRDQVDYKFCILAMFNKEYNDLANRRTTKEAVLKDFIENWNNGTIKYENPLRKPLSIRTLKRYISQEKKYRETNDLSVFAPGYGKRKGQTKLQDDEKEFIKAIFLHPNKLNIKTIWEEYKKRCIELGRDTVSYSVVRRFLMKIPLPAKMKHRNGKKTYNDKCLPFNTRNKDGLKRNDISVSDGHDLNIFIKDDKGRPVRPVLMAWFDIATNKITGFDIEYTENTNLVINSFNDSVRKCGLPGKVYMDNGKAYKNKTTDGFKIDKTAVEGVFTRLGSIVMRAAPYNAKAKPIEPFWNVVNNKFSRKFDSYCGNSVAERSELKDKLAKLENTKLPTLEELIELFEFWVKEYNSTFRSTGKGMNDKTPDEKWAEFNNPIKIIDTKELEIASLYRKEATVSQNGVKYEKYFYCDEKARLVFNYLKEKVVIGINRHDLNYIYVFDKATDELICKADRRLESSWDTTAPQTMAAIKETNRLKKQISKLQKQIVSKKSDLSQIQDSVMLDANKKLIDEVKQLEDKKNEIENSLKGILDR